MRTLLAILIIGTLAVFGARLSTRNVRIPAAMRMFIAGGSLFLLLGLLLGPSGIGFITSDILENLRPVLDLGLGWIGFLVGINLDRRALRRTGGNLLLFAATQASVTLLIVLAVFLAVLPALGWRTGPSCFAAAVILACCASGTAQGTVLRIRSEKGRFRGSIARIIQVVSTLDDLPAVVVFGLLTAFFGRSAFGILQSPLFGFLWLLIATVLGVLFAVLMKWLLEASTSEQVDLLVLLGMLGLSGGIASLLQLSPVFVNAVAGITYINITSRSEKLFTVLSRSEHTIYFLFLIIVGSMWKITGTHHFLLLIILYLVTRTGGKILGGMAGARFARAKALQGARLGMGMLSQGGVAVALAINYHIIYMPASAEDILGVVLLGVLLNEIMAPGLILSASGEEAAR